MKQTNNQKGNVLFLILIAVALFAALSYAVTQSSRSGGDSGRETNILNSAQLTQYPNAVRTAVLRMIIDGRSLTELQFNDPSSFASERVSVFHPNGGGAVYQNASSEIMSTDGGNDDGVWVYSLAFEVPQIGISDGSADSGVIGNDLMALLPGITQSVCERVNTEAGIDGIPTMSNDPATPLADNMDDQYTLPEHTDQVIVTSDDDDFDGQPFGCWEYDDVYTYYHVLNER